MPKTQKVSRKKDNGYLEDPASLAAEYLRGITLSLESFSEFEPFLAALKAFISDDRYLKGSAHLARPGKVEASLPDFDSLNENETVIAVTGGAGNSGHLRYSGKATSKSFGVGDLHLMSALAGCVGSLVAQADRFHQNERSHAVLNFLINQLPIGVLCFEPDGQLILENNLAKRMLGSDGLAEFQTELSLIRTFTDEQRVQLHFEINGSLIYAEGRSFDVEEDLNVRAFVLYDMSSSRAKLMSELDRVAYMSESRGANGVFALLESKEAVGAVYRTLKKLGPELELKSNHIQPLDAYSCGCLFSERSLSDIRFLLKVRLSGISIGGLRVSVVPYQSLPSSDEPGKYWISNARQSLAPAEKAFQPELIVMQDYVPVLESLELILSDECRLRPVKDADEAIRWIKSGLVDGIFVGLDAIDYPDLDLIKSAIRAAGPGFAVFYTTFTRKKMAIRQYDLSLDDKIIEKPFDSDAILEAVALQFDLG
ncbi:MAG: hypothetical protein AAGH40_10715 [Verrucomicrobiota bacterium]